MSSHAHRHSSHHAHSHTVDVERTSVRALSIAFGITATVFLAELIAGFISGSLALLSDAMHMLSDATGLIIALLATLIGRKAATSRATYGYRRVEVLAALINAATVTAVVIWILIQALGRLGGEHHVNTGLMLSVALIGLVANALAAGVLYRAQGAGLNIRGAFLHVLTDLLGSVAVIIAGLVIYFTGFQHADTIASFVIGALVLPRALSLLWQALEVLLERVPRGIDTDQVQRKLSALPDVREVHDLHIWSTDGVTALASCHLVLDNDAAQTAACRVLDQAQLTMRELGIKHTTIQVEHPHHQDHEQVC